MSYLIAQANIKVHPANVWDWIMSLDSDNLAGFAFLSFCGTFAVVLAISLVVYHMHKNRLLDGLKRELLDRGFSAEEIVMIVQAKPRPYVQNPNEMPVTSDMS